MLGTTIQLAIRSILRHKLRSFLTTLGIIIGVAAVVTMVTLGKATTLQVQKSISALGTGILQVRPGQGFGRGGGGPRPPDFKPEDVEAITQQVAGVTAVAPQASTTATAIHEGANWSTTINGTTNAIFTVQPWPLAAGRTWAPEEEQAGKAVCILGNTVVKNLFGGSPRRAVGQRMRIGPISCDVIGVLTTRGQAGFGGDQDDTVVMPIKAVQRRFTGNRDIRLMLVGLNPAYDGAAVQASLTDLLRERRGINGGKEDDFNIFDTKQISDTLSSTTTLLTQIVTAVAAISLVVGGIGIMNIMLVSVTERTREIGLRMALGARRADIRNQFLVEAAVLCVIGGGIGLALAKVAALAFVAYADFPAPIGIGVAVGAILFSAVIGLAFGGYPAIRASRLSPIEALRSE